MTSAQDPQVPAPTGSRDLADRVHQAGRDDAAEDAPAAAPIVRPPRHTRSVPERWGVRGTAIVLSLGTVAILLVGFLIGFMVRGLDSSPNALAVQVPATDSIEAGFARDMIVHHSQGIVMAHYGEIDSQDPEIRLLAYDIASVQQAQVGQMQGWLALWQLPEQVIGPRMAWMPAGGHQMSGMGMTTTLHSTGSTSATGTADDSGFQAKMPGMATSGELARLKTLRGKESDVYFLQLMLRHHQGGKTMMQYAADRAANPIVANFAGKMLEAQTSEATVMTQMLALRGAQPLPFTPPS